MHMFLYLIPADGITCPMGAEHRTGGVFRIALTVVADGFNDFFPVVAQIVTGRFQEQPSPASGIAIDFCLITPHGCGRYPACQTCRLPVCLRRLETAGHLLDICHGPSHGLRRDFQPEQIPGFQQTTVCLHQSLTDRPVGCLAEIASFRVLQMRSASDQCNPDIGDGRTSQYAGMFPLQQVSHHQPLPVAVQHILTAVTAYDKTAAPLAWFQQQMHLRIMAQRLKMPHTLHRITDGFFVDDISLVKLHLGLKPPGNEAFENLDLHLAHHLSVDLFQAAVPDDMQLWFFLFQHPQILQQHMDITALWRQHPVGKHRFQQGLHIILLASQSLPGLGKGQSGHRADCSRRRFLQRFVPSAGIEADLIRLFTDAIPLQQRFHLQDAAGDFHMRQPVPLLVPGNFIDSGRELILVQRTSGI